MSTHFRGIGMTSQRTRDRMVDRLRVQGITHPAVLDALRKTPRHIFVDEALASRAYEDTALPIGHGQTISQPYVVARMSEMLLSSAGSIDKVLEIGTGCGYQTAILAQLMHNVFSIERIRALLFAARERLYALGLHNVRLRHADGFMGWMEYAPFDAILLTAAPASIPDALLRQLNEGGRLVAPVGVRGEQRLVVLTRQGQRFQRQELDAVSFVPMLAGTG